MTHEHSFCARIHRSRQSRYPRLASAALLSALLLCAGTAPSTAQTAQPADKTNPATKPGCPEKPLDNVPFQLELSALLTEKDLEKVLSSLEALEYCDILDPISQKIDEFHTDRRDVRTAILMVRTLSKGPVDMNDTHIQNAVKLMAFQVEQLGDDAQRILLAYAAQKLGGSEETEALLAFVRGNLPDWVEPLNVAVTQPVARGPWNPPGGQAIPFYIGNEAHDAIAKHYMAAHATETVRANSIPISAVLIQLAKRGIGPAANATAQAKGARAARPDIVNLTTNEIYEIKPVGAESVARALVTKHVATFAAAGVTMVPGNIFSPGVDGVVPAPGGHYVFYAYTSGVIVYRYQRGDYVPAPVPVPGNAGEPSLKPALVPVAAEGKPSPVGAKAPDDDSFWETMEKATGLTGVSLGIYIVISEGSRVAFPPRNAIPIP